MKFINVFKSLWFHATAVASVFLLILHGHPIFASNFDTKLKYTLKSDLHWKRDIETEAPAEGYERYILEEDPSIDILFSYTNDDLLSDIQKNGLDRFIKQITRGKNTAQKLFSDQPLKLFNVNSKKTSNGENVSYETNYNLNKTLYSTYEILYLYPGNSLQAALRWKDSSNKDVLKKARISFSQIKVEELSGNARD